MRLYKISALCLMLMACGHTQQNEAAVIFPVTSSTSYTGSFVNNLRGGITRGATYTGLLTWKLEAGLNDIPFNGSGTIHLAVANSHGGQPSATMIGDYQGMLNIEAGSNSFLYELWYSHLFDGYSIKIGLQDLNTDFANSRYASLFQNSSFGIHSTLSKTTTCPVFPATALGAAITLPLNRNTTFRAGAFNSRHSDFSKNQYNIHWTLDGSNGYIIIAETELLNIIPDASGVLIKIGSCFVNLSGNSANENFTRHSHVSLYSLLEYDLGKIPGTRGQYSLFSQLGYTPRAASVNHLYYSAGIHFTAPFKQRENDLAGLAVARAVLNIPSDIAETAIELLYRASLTQGIYLQPDLQYIINPSGTAGVLPDALAFSVQFGMNF